MKTTRCGVDGCGRVTIARDLCKMHYQRMRTRGTTDRFLRYAPPAERLAAKLVETVGGCLEWTGKTVPKGYGQIWVDGRRVYTHRLAWELVNGPILDDLKALHHCDNPPCCQTEPTEGYPEGHLFLGTDVDNMADMVAKGRGCGQKITHCPQGHPYDETNTYLWRGGRRCRVCKSAIAARSYAAKRRASLVEAA